MTFKALPCNYCVSVA